MIQILDMEPLYSKSTKQPRIVLQKHPQQEQSHSRSSPSVLRNLCNLLPAKQPPAEFPTFLRRLLMVLTCGTLGFLYLYYNNDLPSPEFHAGHAGLNAFQDDVQIQNVVSCSEAANSTDPCQIERPAGVLILAQLYDPNLGTADGWGIHGLWPNFCNGKPNHPLLPIQNPTLLKRQ